MKKVFITGITGFVGSNIARACINCGYEVHGLVREASSLWRVKDVLSKLHLHKGELTDLQKLKELVLDINPETILHLAIFGGRPNQINEMEIINSNFIGTFNLINACESINYTCFINTGSSSEYGIKEKPMNENDCCSPVNLYGITKLSTTHYCNLTAATKNRNIGTIRLFSPFGNFEEKGRLFPDIIINAISNKDIKLGNPAAVRDFIHIDDVVDLYMKVIEDPEKIKGEIFNCGFGQQHSIEYVANNILKIANSKSKIFFNTHSGRDSDTKTWVSDITKVTNVFKWKPSLSFDESLNKCYQWFSRNLDLYTMEG
jgi:nucleoside-diphosphate-sugar epimerase